MGYLYEYRPHHLKQHTSIEAKHVTNAALGRVGICFTLIVFEIGWGKGDNKRSPLVNRFCLRGALRALVIGSFRATGKISAIMGLLTVFGLRGHTRGVGGARLDDGPERRPMHQFYKGRLVRHTWARQMRGGTIKVRKYGKQSPETTFPRRLKNASEEALSSD